MLWEIAHARQTAGDGSSVRAVTIRHRQCLAWMRFMAFAALLAFLTTVASAQIHVGPGQTYPDLGSAGHGRGIKAGDPVYLHAGTYKNAVYWTDSLMGRPDAWITIEP